MVYPSKAVLGLLGLAAVAAASDVHDLKTDTFKPFIESNDLVLAEFFAPWCGHCKALAPEYEEAATTLKEKNIALAKVDCTAEADLCSSYGVEGYPTLKVFRGPDNVQPYQGQRKAQAIITYMTKQSMPVVSTLNSETLPEFKTADKVVVVGYFAADDQSSNDTFTSVAEKLRDSYLFGATSDSSLAGTEEVTPPAVVVYKSFDEGKNTLEEATLDAGSIQDFIAKSAMPLIGEVGPETYPGYVASGLPLAYIFAETPEERKTLAEELRPIAEKHKGAINFATIDAKSFGQHASNLNLQVGKWPAFAIQELAKSQKFPFDQEEKISEKSISAFVEKFAAGSLEPSVKSEPIPEKQEGPVTVVVAKNYEDVVLDDEKDVLVEFYAPWCGHCKALAPKYEELASLYTSNPSKANLVTVAKVDATANDVPDEIQGFPTIKLFAAGKKGEPITYGGARTVEDLAKFIAEKGTHKINGLEDAAGSNESEKLKVQNPGEDDLPHQAPAASKVVDDEEAESTGGVKESVKAAASKVAEVVKDTVMDDGTEAAMDDHDEL